MTTLLERLSDYYLDDIYTAQEYKSELIIAITKMPDDDLRSLANRLSYEVLTAAQVIEQP
jgi:hypothetical protein